ncbi:MAG: sigma-70 family RNA polymerase sigma factor [Chloroflexi bacterium]|nr:MAG: sigma-70 family RNA polymerase sigma factor [Chloroflexota bacterium]
MTKLTDSLGVIHHDDAPELPARPELPENVAVERAAKGDTEAFSLLYERYVTRIYNYIYYRTGNPHEAEDLTSRVFHRALHHINHYDNRGIPFSAWLYRIAHNLVANWHRDNSRRKEVPLEDYTQQPHRSLAPEASVVDNQEMEDLLKAIRRLPPDRQQLLILKFVEGMSNAEVATIMMRSEGAIKSLYHRTLISLRDELSKIDHKE